MPNVTLPIAFGLGVASFASPCVVPLVPVYLANIAGMSALSSELSSRRHIVFNTLFFVAGFSLIFIALGTVLNLVVANIPMDVKQTISGSLLIVFGLFLFAATRIPWLNYEKRMSFNQARGSGYVRSLLVGAIFSIGWTPCIGPIIGGVLAMASYGGDVWQAIPPLTAYCVGLGLPFIVIGLLLGTEKATRAIRWLSRHAVVTSAVSAALLVIIGVLMLTGNLGAMGNL